MKPERWHRIGEILHQALECPPEDRDSLLAEACGVDAALRREVESLIRADESAGSFLGQPLLEEPAGDPGAWAERRIGAYRLLRKIGEGGMSTVYVAIRDDDQYRRQVAIKFLRLGVEREDHLRRFHIERQILASLDHPNIAHLYDGGTTEEGVPYFVMEHIEGEPIDIYCDRNALRIRDRLELFHTVCSAVHYAHQNLVVHRDLKPGNILVAADGVPKLLDFGIAKLLNPAPPGTVDPTTTLQRALTPAYASPEQVQGKLITTASDVYSLGVLFYKLLTSDLPHSFAIHTPQEIERVLMEEEPEKMSMVVSRLRSAGEGAPGRELVSQARSSEPAELRRQLTGDLDNIAAKALRTEPQRRYGSVEQLAEDLRRHLIGLPVLAHPDSFRYRARKYLRRHMAGVGVTAAFVALVLASAVLLALQSTRIADERDLARLERDKSRQALTFIEGIFQGADPGEARGDELSAQQVVERGTGRVFEELREQPEVQASIVNSLGNIYRNLGFYERADELLRSALEIRRKTLGPVHSDFAESLNDLSLLLMDQSKFDEAEPLLHEALTIRSRTLGDEHSETGETVNNIGLIESYKGRYEMSETYLRRGLRINRKAFGDEHSYVALSLNNLAATLMRKGDPEEAETAFREALAIQRKVFGDVHPEIGVTLANLGLVYRFKGELDTAEQVLRESLTMRQKLFGVEHLDIAVSLNSLGLVMKEKGDHEQAQRLLGDALAMWIRLFGKDNLRSATIHYNLANVFHAKGERVRAEELYRESLAIFARSASEKHPHVAVTLQGLGKLLLEDGQVEEALPKLTRAVEILRQTLPANHPQTTLAESRLGECLTRLERYDEAESLLIESYRRFEVQRPPNDPETIFARQRVVALYEAWGKPEKTSEYRANPPAPPSAPSTP